MKLSIGGILSAGIKLVNHRVELERIKELLEPAINHLVRVWPELWAVTRNLLIELGVMKEGDSEAYLAGFSPRWLQEGLKRTVDPDLLVDGFLGKKTEAAVKAFQARHGLTVDGRPRIKTCIKLWLEIDGDFT
jgi:hypothetical protein